MLSDLYLIFIRNMNLLYFIFSLLLFNVLYGLFNPMVYIDLILILYIYYLYYDPDLFLY